MVIFFLLSLEVRFTSHSIILRHILLKCVHAYPGTIFCHHSALKRARDFCLSAEAQARPPEEQLSYSLCADTNGRQAFKMVFSCFFIKKK